MSIALVCCHKIFIMPRIQDAKGFTLIELLVVLIIVGILTGLAIPGFTKTREKALDKEAQVSLNLIQAAEKMYNAKYSGYYPGTGITETLLSNINSNLQLDLVAGSWAYSILGAGTDFTANAARARSAGSATWKITKDTEPCCTGPGCLSGPTC